MTEITTKERQLEIELLLCCARTEVDSKCSDRIRYLAQKNIDWDYLLKLAKFHQITPLISWQLQTVGQDLIPKSVLEEFRQAFNANAKRNFGLTGELLSILNLFQKESIPIIPFKGVALAHFAYRNNLLREFLDLDVLIPVKFGSSGIAW
jgi:hypothetical protein